MESSEQQAAPDLTGEHQETKEGALSPEEQAPPSGDPAPAEDAPSEEPVQADPDPGDPAPEGAIPEGQAFDPTHSAPATMPNEQGVQRQHGDVNPELGQSPSAFPGETPAEEPADEEPSDQGE